MGFRERDSQSRKARGPAGGLAGWRPVFPRETPYWNVPGTVDIRGLCGSLGVFGEEEMTLPPQPSDPATIQPSSQRLPLLAFGRPKPRGEFPEPIGKNVEENSFENYLNFPEARRPRRRLRRPERNEQLLIEAVPMN